MLKKIQDTTPLYEQVVEQIKSMIVQGIYKKGDMLPSEKELIQMTGVSRITVREALRMLAEVGMIETRKGKGSFVLVDQENLVSSEADKEQKQEYQTFFINSSKARLVLEPGIAREAAINADEDDIAAIEKTLEVRKGGRSLESSGFHYAVARAAKNPLLLEFMNSLLETEEQAELRFQAVLRLATPEHQKRTSAELVNQHRKILEAIRNHDPEFAYFYMMEHTRYLLHSYEEYFEWFLS